MIFCAPIGNNGAGKITVLRTISRLKGARSVNERGATHGYSIQQLLGWHCSTFSHSRADGTRGDRVLSDLVANELQHSRRSAFRQEGTRIPSSTTPRHLPNLYRGSIVSRDQVNTVHGAFLRCYY